LALQALQAQSHEQLSAKVRAQYALIRSAH
jgi:hypothetical protein